MYARQKTLAKPVFKKSCDLDRRRWTRAREKKEAAAQRELERRELERREQERLEKERERAERARLVADALRAMEVRARAHSSPESDGVPIPAIEFSLFLARRGCNDVKFLVVHRLV